MKNRLAIILILLLSLNQLYSQEHKQNYFPVTDSMVAEKLEQWQDLKFGLLMHWGAYSQWGIVESWSICPEDYGWCERKKEGTPDTYFEYVKAYENLKTTFNPVEFNPRMWANAAKKAGMKYVVFTTKHHDGFCMFDSKFTDYKVTDKDCLFSNSKQSNITLEIFNAFRKEGLWTGAYFSKPDWHCDDYWWPYFPPRDRNVNYDPVAYPDKWNSYVDFTHNQIMELLSDYGKVDILWLDGGWVAKTSNSEIKNFYQSKLEETDYGFFKSTIVNQDIKMDELVTKARKVQPGLIVVDRAVEGPNQNYLTPENRVPEEALPYPWESCIIAGGGWSYVPDAKFMSGFDAVHMLTDIVCKGGNLLLNIAPSPEGTWPEGAYKLLGEIGEWMDVNSEAIYETRAIAPYKESEICFTRKKDSKTIYAIFNAKDENSKMPKEIIIKSFDLNNDSKISLLGSKEKISWKKSGDGIVISVSSKLQKNPPCNYAWCFKIEDVNIDSFN